MKRYVVVTRDKKLPIDRYYSVDAAARKIVLERSFDRWTVLVQEANRITASTPYRELNPHERRELERHLYPTLFDD
jgi:hypothetical protein